MRISAIKNLLLAVPITSVLAQTPAPQVNVLYECEDAESIKILSCSGPAGSAICDLQAYQGGQPALRVSMPPQQIATLLLPKCHVQTAAEAKDHPQSSALTTSVNGTSGAPLAQADAARANLKQDEGQRALARCISSGRLPASCTGNTLLGGFTQMISQVLPSAAKESAPGPNMAGVYQGAGGWRLDFFDGVLVSCASLAPDHHNYTIDFKTGRPTITIDTAPKPLVLTLKEDGTITGPGPFVLDGVVITGYTSGGGTPSSLYKDQFGNPVDVNGNRLYAAAPQPIFGPRRATCPALNLSSQGAGAGMAMQTDLLKTIFGGDKGPPTPPGIRMHGLFAASSGFSAEFFPESVVLGCGPDAARAYPYAVVSDGARPAIKIAAPDHPLALGLRADGSLDAGSGPYQVHGRTLIGQNDNGGFNFAPLEQTCNLAVLTPSGQIPAGGTVAPGQAGGQPATAAPQVAVASAPLAKASPAMGNAVLSLVGFPNAGGANPLTGHAFFLLKDSFDNVLLKGGVQPLAGKTPMQSWMLACDQSAATCRQAMANMGAYTAGVVRMDAAGKGTFPEVPPGTYYLFGSGVVNGKPTAWSFPARLTPGQNSVTIDRSNAAQF